MLSQLLIQNIALIDKLELELREGLNILSGETGAGKSIIIDSLNFVLGERADRSLIRYGTEFAVVQAVFSEYLNDDIAEYLDSIGIEAEEILIIRRKMSVEGKNECRINGRQVTLGILKGLTELLVDIHGQHEHQSLLKSANHIILLDSMGGEKLATLKGQVKDARREYWALKKELMRFGDESERMRRMDVLSYQIEEIESADVKQGEEEELLAQRKRIRNMERILNAVATARGALDGGDGYGATVSAKNAEAALRSILSYDSSVEEYADRLDSARLELKDIADSLGELLDKLDYDSRYADSVEQRLELVRQLTRKYGGSYEALSQFYEKAKEEFDVLSKAGDRVASLEKSIKTAAEKLTDEANKLTKLRKEEAKRFSDRILGELKDLGMNGSTFSVNIVSTDNVDEIGADGGDAVEFLISPNVGEPLKPLAKIISGGEMSRFMLALKNIVAGVDNIGTLVFDEIDTGISGNISQVVSQKLCNISRIRQVIAVTHMPSLAVMADNHYLIAKSECNGKTLTNVTLLEDDTEEVARLIGGDGYSVYAIPHAKEMKAWAERYKASLKK